MAPGLMATLGIDWNNLQQVLALAHGVPQSQEVTPTSIGGALPSMVTPSFVGMSFNCLTPCTPCSPGPVNGPVHGIGEHKLRTDIVSTPLQKQSGRRGIPPPPVHSDPLYDFPSFRDHHLQGSTRRTPTHQRRKRSSERSPHPDDRLEEG